MKISRKENDALHIAESFVEILQKVKGFNNYFNDCSDKPLYSQEMFTDCKINYLSYRYEDGGLISYCPEGKIQQFRPDGKWMRKDRQTGKPARILKKIFTKSFFDIYHIKEDDISFISTCCKVNMDFSNVYESTSINEIYNYETSDWPTSSCMQDKSYMTFVEQAGGRIAYIMNAESKLEGRALIWPNVISHIHNDPITIMDRQYGTEEARIKLSAYGKSKGYYVREKNNVDDTCDFIAPTGEFVELRLKVEHKGVLDTMPYLDTFRWINSTYCYNIEDLGIYEANNTDGTLTGYNDHNGEVETDLSGWVREDAVRTCGYCGDTGDEDCFSYSETSDYDVCDECRERHFVHDSDYNLHLAKSCEHCAGTDTYHYDTDNISYSEYHNTNIEHENSTFCDFTEDYYYNNEVILLETAKGAINVFKEKLNEALEHYGHPNLEPTNQ